MCDFCFCFCFVLFCLVAVVSRCFSPCYTVGESGTCDAPPCGCLPLSLFDLVAVPLSLLLHFILFRCPCPCFVFLFGLSCTIYICIWLPFLPYAYYMWLPWFVLFLFLGFSPPESLPGYDVLCRLLPRALPSVCFLFFSFLFFSDRVRPQFVLV